MTDSIVIIVLGAILVISAIERILYTRMMTEKLENAMKAVMSRNIHEFLQATKKEKPNQQREVDPDEVSLDIATDEEFDAHIKEQTK